MIMEQNVKIIFVAIVAVVVLTTIIVVSIAMQKTMPEANIPSTCDVVEGSVGGPVGGAVGKLMCLPLKVAGWGLDKSG